MTSDGSAISDLGTVDANGVATEGDSIRLAAEATRFYSLPEVREIVAPDRLESVLLEISATGSYTHSTAELLTGAKLAWRNHARCIGRYTWRALSLIDARMCDTAQDVAEACWEHLRVSTNNGKLRPVVTVFKPYLAPDNCVRFVNHELIRYAGYIGPDGHPVGDPQYVELTRKAMSLGWRGAGTPFDVLPVILCLDGKPPEIFDVPPDCVLEVPIQHPRFDWFRDLNLRWHANPAVSDMCMEIGGLKYSGAPFSGWYVNPEIGARNLSDTYRYNMLPVIAERMGLDVSRNTSLWRDRALLELNEAVIYSYAAAGVYMIDHHTAATQFMAHIEREARAGRTVPTEWSWINPPMSASTTPTFHRLFDPPDPDIRPSFYRQEDVAAHADDDEWPIEQPPATH
jgi:nitric-oxide synthase, bacterial